MVDAHFAQVMQLSHRFILDTQGRMTDASDVVKALRHCGGLPMTHVDKLRVDRQQGLQEILNKYKHVESVVKQVLPDRVLEARFAPGGDTMHEVSNQPASLGRLNRQGKHSMPKWLQRYTEENPLRLDIEYFLAAREARPSARRTAPAIQPQVQQQMGEEEVSLTGDECGMCNKLTHATSETMIECDGSCGNWYHDVCVGKPDVVDGAHWLCPDCEANEVKKGEMEAEVDQRDVDDDAEEEDDDDDDDEGEGPPDGEGCGDREGGRSDVEEEGTLLPLTKTLICHTALTVEKVRLDTDVGVPEDADVGVPKEGGGSEDDGMSDDEDSEMQDKELEGDEANDGGGSEDGGMSDDEDGEVQEEEQSQQRECQVEDEEEDGDEEVQEAHLCPTCTRNFLTEERLAEHMKDPTCTAREAQDVTSRALREMVRRLESGETAMYNRDTLSIADLRRTDRVFKREAGWATRGKRGDLYGETYMTQEMKNIVKQLFEEGEQNKGRKWSPAQMQEEMRKRNKGSLAIPGLLIIQSTVSQLSGKKKD